ncbi:MAG: 4'-phosphopantetheinyl transferase superfamily protein [Lachnospiraceae bacterium]|nr:4'-phosphopantetheinyl transferase superfamily protein [Lachnospiraceae bacterium]
MDLYVANINSFTIDDLVPHVSDERKKVSFRFVKDADKKRSLLAHALLNRAVSDRFPGTGLPVNTDIDEQGKPHVFLPGDTNDDGSAKEMHFSLSHSGDYAICAVDDDIIGADIELIDDNPVSYDKIATRFFCREEAAAINSTESFFKIWTLKESFTKAVGLGLGLPLDLFRIFDFNSHEKTFRFVLEGSKDIPDQLTPFINSNSEFFDLYGSCSIFEEHYALSFTTMSPDPEIIFHHIDDPVNL